MYRAALLVSQCLNEAATMGRATPLALESVGLSELFRAVNSPTGLAVVKEYDDGIKIRVDRRKAGAERRHARPQPSSVDERLP